MLDVPTETLPPGFYERKRVQIRANFRAFAPPELKDIMHPNSPNEAFDRVMNVRKEKGKKRKQSKGEEVLKACPKKFNSVREEEF